MASYRIQINAPTKDEGSALEHAQYIGREGRFTAEKYGEVVARGEANFPAWAREDKSAFWKASDQYERANGSVYREFELTLPRELSRDEQIGLVQRFASQELGSTRVYQWAMHAPMASDGGEQPHAHVMFSDRQLDGIERGPEQFFKRYNAKHPERGGCRKATYGANKAEAAQVYEQIRERWATVQNQALERAGVAVRVDHRSLKEQGVFDREPQLHRGPAVSGIEARGQVSQVGARQRAQRQARALAREAVVAEVRVVTRQEVALERVAVKERRELAKEVTGEDREAVLKCVEADRREQIERAQAMAERRVERRQGLGIGGQLKEKLLTQARGLRERIGQQLSRVREWMAERFPDPERLRERSRELLDGMARKVRAAGGPGADEVAQAAGEKWKRLYGNQARPSVEETQRQAREAWGKLRREQEEQAKVSAAQIAPLLPANRPGRARAESMREWREMIAAKPIELQGQVLAALRTRLQEARAGRLDGVLERAQARHERRVGRVRQLAKEEPCAPKGVLGALRRRAHEQTHRAWRERSQGLQRLSDQSHRQQQRLIDARADLMLQAHASRILKQYAPELLERVQVHTREQHRLERERSLERSRGKDLDRDFDLER